MKKILPAIFFLILSTTIIFSWFRFGLIYGGGDVGLSTYDPRRIIEVARYIWWEASAPGFLVPHGITSVPFLTFLSFFQLLNLPPVGLQAITFFILLFLMGFGMYLLVRILFNQSYKLAILAGIFYMFNPYMMISVWHRFVHSTFFLAAALPFLVLFWIKWIQNKQVVYLLLFLLTNLLALYLFGTIAFIVTIWLFLSLITLGEGIFPWTGFKNSIGIGIRFLVGFILWTLTNVWWLLPVFTIGPALFSQQHTAEESLVTLINISRQGIFPYSLQMVNPFYLFYQQELGGFYDYLLVRFLPWLFVALVIIGLLKGLMQEKFVRWSIIFLIVLFLAKGASSPFGNIFVWGFKYFFPLGVLRNPFEKVGILLPFIASILFVVGAVTISNYLRKKFNEKFVNTFLLIVVLTITIFHWPMLKGQLFGRFDKPAFVKVPGSYSQADRWIKSDFKKDPIQNLGKILHLPLTRQESVTYKWEHGYSGLEPSALFFTSLPSISHGFNIARVDDSLTALSLVFHKPYSKDSQKILKLLQDFNVRYIVLHKDVKWQGGDLYDPEQTEDVLNNLSFLKPVQQFGDLLIYKLEDEFFKPKITLASNIQLVYPHDKGFIWPWLIGNGNAMITPIDQKISDEIFKLANQVVIFPHTTFNYPGGLSSAIPATINQIITDDAIADSLTLPFTTIKPILSQNGELQSEKLNEKLILVNKELVKILRSNTGIKKYHNLLNQIFSGSLRDSRLLAYINEQDISLIFQVHLSALEVLANQVDPGSRSEITNAYNFLKDHLIKDNFIPQNPPNLGLEQKIFKFQIPKALPYEILMTDTEGLEKISLNINGQMTNLIGQKRDGFISYSARDFDPGLVEIGYTVSHSANLAQPYDEMAKSGNVTVADNAIQITPQGQFGHIQSLLPNVKGGDIYKVSFEAMAKSGNGFYLQLVQDTDTFDQNNQRIQQLNQFIDRSKQNDWQSSSFILLPLRLTTQQAALRFVVAANQQTLTPPIILIRNLRIEKVLNSGIALKGILTQPVVESLGGELINIKQKNPVLYQGRVKIVKPTFLIFSETYHPEWKLTLKSKDKVYIPDKHLIANLFGNGWFIDEIGEYDFNLEFEPQRKVYIGAILSIVIFSGLIAFLIGDKLLRQRR